LVSGLQAALGRLGKSPPNLGTDNTSAATHELEEMPGRARAYNADYLELCTHYDLSPITIHVGCPNEHGDVESLNRHLKRRLNLKDA
jgi:transposase InsO family protein